MNRDLINTTTFDFPWLTTTEAARVKGVHKDSIQKALQRHEMVAVKVGKPGPGRSLWLIHPQTLREWDMQRDRDLDRRGAPLPEYFPWIDSVEAGERKGLLGRTMQKVLERGELSYVKIGKPGKGRALYLIHEDDLEEWWPKWVASATSPMDSVRSPGKTKKESPRLPLALPAGEDDQAEQDENHVPLVEGEWV